MAVYYYKEARRLADRACRENIAKGLSPTLPILDDFIATERSTSAVYLGLVSVPLKFIIGTKTRGRVNAFAPNFMPILDEETEFAAKWESLCQSHLSEGIREPVKLYEYLNRYYVEEGNKRVSVLKFFDAVSIPAEVYRIYPKKSADDEQVVIYYEYADFYQLSKINFLDFSKRGSFQELQKLSGKEKDESWSDDERRHFTGAYYYFEQAFEQNGGEKLSTTAADAMLSYIRVYGFEEFLSADVDEFKANLKKMWEEIKLGEHRNSIELMSQPAEEKRQGMFQKVFEHAMGVRKVAFVYDGNPETSGWVNEHEVGRLHVEKVFEGRIETSVYPDAMKDDPVKVIEKAVSDGNELIFTTSPRLLDSSLRVAIEYPNVIIMNCSLNKSHRYVRSYYPRMYEVKFILGLLAGSMSSSGKVGYVCDYPIFGQIAGINAFALGAQMANPKAKVFLEWSGVKGAKEAAQALCDKGIHYISSHDTARFRFDDRRAYGLSHITKRSFEILAVPLWKWGAYYEAILRRHFDNTVREEYEHSDKALNYYWGMSAGVVDVKYCEALPLPSRKFADFFRDSFIQDTITPFLTPFYAQDGTEIGEGELALSLEQIINMDYLVENVIGEIPAYSELTPIGQATVDAVGVEPAQTDGEKDGDRG